MQGADIAEAPAVSEAYAAKTSSLYSYSQYELFEDKYQQYRENGAASLKRLQDAQTVNDVPHSGPQGKVVPLTIIDDPADWKAEDLVGREVEYTYRFTAQDVAEITSSVDALKASGVATEDDVQQLTKADYSWPTLSPKLVAFAREVSQGRGFQLFKGFPVQQYKGDRLGLVLAYWGVALHIGRPLVSQTDYRADGTVFGSVLNHITVGRHAAVYKPPAADTKSSHDQIKQTGGKSFDTSPLQFHSDQGATDIISMLSLSQSKEGGVSKWVSAIAIHNELLRRGRKDLVEILSRPGIWYTLRKANQAAYEADTEGKASSFEETIPFSYHDGYLSVHFEAAKYQDVKLSPLQEEAIWAVAALAQDPKFHLARRFEPGDMEWIHNPTSFHDRDAIIDGDEPHEKRHLLRFWVHTHDDPRPIAPKFAPRSNVQATGGFAVPEGKLRLPFFPYSRHDGEGISDVY